MKLRTYSETRTLEFLQRRESETLAAESVRLVIELQLCLLDSSLDQLIEDSNVGRFFDSRLAFRLRQWLGVLKGSDLGLEFFVELPQCLLFMDDIFAFESHLLPITI